MHPLSFQAVCKVQLCGRSGDGEAADFGERPSTARKHRGRETSPISGVVNPGMRHVDFAMSLPHVTVLP